MKHDPPTCRGTRTELLTELRQASEGWRHFGKHDLSNQAEAGIRQLETGVATVQVGHTIYTVTD